jgi:hypothetical protein
MAEIARRMEAAAHHGDFGAMDALLAELSAEWHVLRPILMSKIA